MTISPRASKKGYPGLKQDNPDDEDFKRETTEVVNGILEGNINNRGTITLTDSSATSTLSDKRISGGSVIHFTPTNENARGEGSPAVTAQDDGTATLTHPNNSNERTYQYTVFG